MTEHPSLVGGSPVRWVGRDYVETLGDGSVGRVRRGDVGTFVAVDGPDHDGAVVDFPPVGAFVCAWSDVTTVPRPGTHR